MTGALSVLRMAMAALRGQADPPADVVKSATVRITDAIRRARSHGPSWSGLTPQRLQRVHGEARRVVTEVFDLERMAQSILSRHWTERTASQQAEFRRFLTEFLTRSSVAYLKDSRRALALQVGGSVEGNFATVDWRVSTPQAPALLTYRLLLKAGRWKVYDVLLNRESFVGICRSCFDRATKPPLDPTSIAPALAEAIHGWGRAAGVELSLVSL